MINLIKRDKSCITGKPNLENLYTFKKFPIFFGCTNRPIEEDLLADMIWDIDTETGFIQLSSLIPLDLLYMEQHVDATGPTWSRYNNDFSDYVLKNCSGDILEIGGGSGKIANIILNKESNIHFTVVEPNPLFEERENLKIIKAFFSKDLKHQILENHTVIFSQVYEHVYDPEQFLVEINGFLPVGGKLIFAYPNLEYWFKNKFTNAINFEHSMLMTDYFVDYFLAKTGFKIIEKFEYESHSHFYTVEKAISSTNFNLVNKYDHYKNMFIEYLDYHFNLVNELNIKIKDVKNPIFLFGAHIFSQYLFSFGLDQGNLISILDNSPIKQGKRLYGSNLKVDSPKILENYENPIVILKAGLYNKEIMEDISQNINPNTIFI
jgi:SAM-dependent methyltransferase